MQQRSRLSRSFVLPPILVGFAVAMLVVTAAAHEPPEELSSTAPHDEKAAPMTAVRVFVDPATGELTSEPSPAQVEALSKRTAPTRNFSFEGLEPFPLAGGGRGVYLEGRFRSALVVRIDTDGRSTLSCVHDPDHGALPSPQETAPEWVER